MLIVHFSSDFISTSRYLISFLLCIFFLLYIYNRGELFMSRNWCILKKTFFHSSRADFWLVLVALYEFTILVKRSFCENVKTRYRILLPFYFNLYPIIVFTFMFPSLIFIKGWNTFYTEDSMFICCCCCCCCCFCCYVVNFLLLLL